MKMKVLIFCVTLHALLFAGCFEPLEPESEVTVKSRQYTNIAASGFTPSFQFEAPSFYAIDDIGFITIDLCRLMANADQLLIGKVQSISVIETVSGCDLTTYPYSGPYRRIAMQTEDGSIERIVLLAKHLSHRDIVVGRRIAMGVHWSKGELFGLGYVFIEDSSTNIRRYPRVSISLPSQLSELRVQAQNIGACTSFSRLDDAAFDKYTHVAKEIAGCQRPVQRAPITAPGEMTDEML